jgi:AcrR family transcriptional regulator
MENVRYRMGMAEPRTRLSAESWATAALAAIGEGGLGAVAVEPIAARLGATKGSFYWHFANREALVAAALAQWEERHTGRVIAEVEATTEDPAQRLRVLFAAVTGHARADAIELGLLAAADHPLVGSVVERVARRRIDYLVGLFTALGFPAPEARRRGLWAYSTYLGNLQLTGRMPALLPTGKAATRYLDSVVAAMLR